MDTEWDELTEELDHHRQMTRELRRRQWALELQLAQQGTHTPPHVQTELDSLARQIQHHEIRITEIQAILQGRYTNNNTAPTTQPSRSQFPSNADVLTTRTFATAAAFLAYAASRAGEAGTSVDDITWGRSEPNFTRADEDAYEAFLDAIEHVCQRGVLYREVISFHERHYVERAEAFLAKGYASFQLKYYEFDADATPPLLHFLIIDSDEVLIAFYRWPFLAPQKEVRLATRQPDLVRLFEDYYETMWQGAKPLKIAEKIETVTFEAIKRQWYAS